MLRTVKFFLWHRWLKVDGLCQLLQILLSLAVLSLFAKAIPGALRAFL